MSNGAKPAETALAKELVTHLCRHYPGYHWGVDVEDGVIKVMNAELTGRHGYIVKVPGNYVWKALADAVMRGAGEILERYRLSRVARSDDQMQALKRDVRGDAVGEVS